MRRREFLERVAFGGAGIAWGGALNGTHTAFASGEKDRASDGAPKGEKEGKKAFRLRYLLASSMYGKLPLADVLPEVRKTGADAIDIWPLPHADHREQIEAMGFDAFSKLLETHRVKLGMVSLYSQKQFRMAREIPILAKHGGRLVVTAGKIRNPVRAIESMRGTLDLAREHGVRVSIENHGETLDEIRRFADAAAKIEAIGVALAPLHLKTKEAELPKLVEDLGEKLFHFYAWQYGKGHSHRDAKLAMHQMPGVGSLDFRPMLGALKKIEYRHWTEIFMHPTPRGIPILPTAAQVTAAIVRSRDYLEKCLAEGS